MKVSRRVILRGIGGAVLGLPLLESVGRPAPARAGSDRSFAVFFRQANGVAAASPTDLGDEPERFWPRSTGPLTLDSLRGRTLELLAPHRERLLVVGNVNAAELGHGDGHARGALQCLTAADPVTRRAGGDAEAAGPSIDHLLGLELNPDGRESWFMYAGHAGGWLGGPCISYRGPGERRSPIHDPFHGYLQLVGGEAGLSGEARWQIAERGRSVNDLVRSQLVRLQSHPRLGARDRRRLELHQSAIRDLEGRLQCSVHEDQARRLEGLGPLHGSYDGDEVLQAVRAHIDVAALALSCGVTRSIAIQVGSGNDGTTRYRDPATGEPLENFHFVSHRRDAHASGEGDVIEGSDAQHAMIDRQFATTFRYLLDRLAEAELPGGESLLDGGVACWLNDCGNGPRHSRKNLPWILAGGAGGRLRTGEYLEVSAGDRDVVNLAPLLRTLASAVGASIEEFGSASYPPGVLPELFV